MLQNNDDRKIANLIFQSQYTIINHYLMKPQKEFVRFKGLHVPSLPEKSNTEKIPFKNSKFHFGGDSSRQALKMVYHTFEPASSIPPQMQKLLDTYPSFFTKTQKHPQEDITQSLNRYVIYNQTQQFEPDWDLNEEVDSNIESRRIDPKIVEQVSKKMANLPTKKTQTLLQHEKNFLQDYYRQKKKQEQQQQSQQPPNNDAASKINRTSQNINLGITFNLPISSDKIINVQQASQSDQSQDPNINAEDFAGEWITPSDENQQQGDIIIEQDNSKFNEAVEEELRKETEKEYQDDVFGDQSLLTYIIKKKTSQKDDIFRNQKPHTFTSKKIQQVPSQKTHILKKTEQVPTKQEKKQYNFKEITQALNFQPDKCVWQLKNNEQFQKVGTDFMEVHYSSKKELCLAYPFVSLNGSPFLRNDYIKTEEGLNQLRNYFGLRNMETTFNYSQ